MCNNNKLDLQKYTDLQLVTKWLRGEAGIESLSKWLKHMYSSDIYINDIDEAIKKEDILKKIS